MSGRRCTPALLACLCFTSFWGAAPRQYVPAWKAGDWWVTKVWQQIENGSSLWHLERYDVDVIAKVDTSDCFVLKERLQSYKGTVMQVGSDIYVRRSDLRVVRRVTFGYGNDRRLLADTSNYPSGQFGPLAGGEPRLPRFPLRLGGKADTVFRPRQRNDSSMLVREMAGVAAPAVVKRLLDDGDTTDRRVVRPAGKVYEARCESSSELQSDSTPATKRITQSLQLWCKEQPWRLYEELAQYDGPQPIRSVVERTWLVASGHTAQ